MMGLSTDQLSVASLNRTISKLTGIFKPPDSLTVSEWAEKHRYMSRESSAENGRWKNSRTPYLVEIMDSVTNPLVRHIVLASSSQVGKSELENNIIGYIIDEDPGSILFVFPTVIDAKEFSKLRIAPMIRDCPTLRAKVKQTTQRDSGNTILQKAFPGGILTCCGSNEAHALASKPIRYVFGDERDRWATSAGKEGDPWLLVMARQTTFYNAKAIEVSTPVLKGSSQIESAYYGGTMERWHSQCPHCGNYHEITWNDIHYDYDEKEVRRQTTFNVKRVWYVCPECGCISSESEMKKAPAKWVAENPDAIKNGTRSFWLSAFVSQWSKWENIVLQYLQAQGNSLKMQVVYNTIFGLPWENRDSTMTEDDLMQRRELYEAELPEGVLVLTAGVDTQKDRMEYLVRGWGQGGESWDIERGWVMGAANDDATWQTLDDVLFDRVWHYHDGIGRKLKYCFVDEAGLYTHYVRKQCSARLSKNVYCIIGANEADAPYIPNKPKQMQILDAHERVIGQCWQYRIGVSSGKQNIFDELAVADPGPKYRHFPLNDHFDYDFFKSLLSEQLVYDDTKVHPWKWEKIPGHKRNEMLDCSNYAGAAFLCAPVNLDAEEAALRHLREDKTANKQAVPPPKRSRLARKPKHDYYNDW